MNIEKVIPGQEFCFKNLLELEKFSIKMGNPKKEEFKISIDSGKNIIAIKH